MRDGEYHCYKINISEIENDMDILGIDLSDKMFDGIYLNDKKEMFYR